MKRTCSACYAKLFEPEVILNCSILRAAKNKVLPTSLLTVWLLFLLLVAVLFLPATRPWSFAAFPFAVPGKIAPASATIEEKLAQAVPIQMGSYGPLSGSLALSLSPKDDLKQVIHGLGKRLDEAGPVWVGARYYDDPALGQFISPDSMGHAGSSDLYSYANGNPIAYCDPDGRLSKGFNTGFSRGGLDSSHSLAYSVGLVGGRAGYEVGSTIHNPIVDAYPVLGSGKMVVQGLTGGDFLGRS